MTKKLHLVSLGCTKNLVDSEVMLGRLKEYEISDDAGTADIIIVNTCGFIDATKEESINTVLNLHEQRKKLHPGHVRYSPITTTQSVNQNSSLTMLKF